MLEYQLQQGPNEQQIIEQALKFGMSIPNRIENAPSLLPGLELYYKGFLDLTTSRTLGLGIGPIPWFAIEMYCRQNELDEEQTEAMHHHVIVMDSVFMKHEAKKK